MPSDCLGTNATGNRGSGIVGSAYRARAGGNCGGACLRLRKRGYKIEVGAYGPQITERSRREIVGKVETLVALLGGLETANQVLRFLRDAEFYHDGLWLFGEVGLNIHDVKRPMVPVGWLFSLALRYLDRPSGARKPNVAWKSLVDLATDFAATHDCQRYSQYEDFNLHASQAGELNAVARVLHPASGTAKGAAADLRCTRGDPDIGR